MSDVAESPDMIVAEVMWKADANRPCGWHELDDDEREEWAVMARAAMQWIRQNAADFVSGFMFPKGSHPKPQDVIGCAKIIALESLQRAADEKQTKRLHRASI